ncbi:MAG: thioredoxin family protein [Bacteroidetes bacterium]|nr:thioredoxin family protein [Bacteroidota bacterium]
MLKPLRIRQGCTSWTFLLITFEVVEKNGINAAITKIDDIMEIMKFGVNSIPALVIDGKVVLKGRVPSSDEIKQLLTK